MVTKIFYKILLLNKKHSFPKMLFIFWFSQWFVWSSMYINNIQNFTSFFHQLLVYCFAFFISFPLRYFYKKYKVHQLPLIKISLIILSASTIFGLLWMFEIHLQYYIFWKTFLFGSYIEILQEIWNQSYVFMGFSIIYIVYKFYQESVIQKQIAANALMLAQSAQLEMLRYQINPHFLFNTLNSARALVLADPPLARDMLTKITEFLRYSISEGINSSIPLIKEIEAINSYLDIEKIRYKENLIIEYNIDEKVGDFEIPVLLVLPLIENAIKHGMRTTTLPLKIDLNAHLINGYIQIEVINSGRWVDTTSNELNTGTGLDNVQKRLSNTYPGNSNLEIIKKDDSIKVIIRIKKEN